MCDIGESNLKMMFFLKVFSLFDVIFVHIYYITLYCYIMQKEMNTPFLNIISYDL